MRFILLMLLCIFFLNGCGHTGGLYLPEPEKPLADQTQQSPGTAPSAMLKPLPEGLN